MIEMMMMMMMMMEGDANRSIKKVVRMRMRTEK